MKGGEGYYRAIREDYPEQFEELCKVQDELGPGSYLHRNRPTNEQFSLRELGEGAVRGNEKLPACSFFCELAEADIIASAYLPHSTGRAWLRAKSRIAKK